MLKHDFWNFISRKSKTTKPEKRKTQSTSFSSQATDRIDLNRTHVDRSQKNVGPTLNIDLRLMILWIRNNQSKWKTFILRSNEFSLKLSHNQRNEPINVKPVLFIFIQTQTVRTKQNYVTVLLMKSRTALKVRIIYIISVLLHIAQPLIMT